MQGARRPLLAQGLRALSLTTVLDNWTATTGTTQAAMPYLTGATTQEVEGTLASCLSRALDGAGFPLGSSTTEIGRHSGCKLARALGTSA